MADIAQQLGISRATVSYVLNERESELISTATRERVLAAAQEMGYRRNRAAQSLKGQRSYLVELCVHGFYPAVYGRALAEFDRQSAPTPYQLHIVKPSHWDEKKWDITDGGWPVDAVLIFEGKLSERALVSLKQRGVPIVSVGINPFTEFDCVKVDLGAAMQAAMRQLTARKGRVAYLSLRAEEKVAAGFDPRYPAYRAAMLEAGLPEEVIISADRDRAGTRQIVRDYVQKNGCPDAFFCFNDERSVAALAALRDLKLRVPEDVKIIGCDGIEETLYHHPALSTIKYPVEEAARLAWQFLLHRLDNPDAPLQSATLAAELVLRESSAW